MTTLLKSTRIVAGVGLVLAGACSSSHGAPEADGGSPAKADAGAARDAGAKHDAGATGKDAAGRDAVSSAPDAPLADGRAPVDGGDAAAPLTGPCTAEAVVSCSCASGMGTRRCLADGSAWGACSCVSYGVELAVAPNGDDSAAGTLAAPWKTLERAQTAVRSMIAAGPLPAGGVAVWLRGGIYPRTATLALTKADSGGAGARVVYRGYPGETARLLGGMQLDASDFTTVTASSPVWGRLDPTAQGQVVAANLTALGITDFGTLEHRASTKTGVTAALELFIDGERQELGRWPDANPTDIAAGFSQIATVAGTTQFTLVTNRTARWTTAPDAWVHGFFIYTWADDRLAVASLDAATGTITTATAPGYGLMSPLRGGAPDPVYAYNLLEEITQQGEWYLDRTSGLLYLWPPANLAQHDLVVSLLNTPLVTVTGASNVTFQELTFDASRSTLIQLSGGSSNVEVVGCTLRDSGDGAATVADGSDNVFDGDLVYDTGEQGISLNGGDRTTLTAAKNTVENSDIHDFGQWVWTYSAAVNVTGDGNVVQHNVIHGSPHTAILFGDSSQTSIQYNDIYNVLLFSSDAGAIYAYRDWGEYGTQIQYNFVHDIASGLPGFGVHGVYMDGCLSGPTVASNVFYNIAGYGVFQNGGHDITTKNNIMVSCKAALEMTSACAMSTTPDCTGDQGDFTTQLEALDYQSPPWSTTYPTCAAIPDSCTTVTASGSQWLTPYGSVFTDNVSFDNTKYIADDGAMTLTYLTATNNLQMGDPLFVDEATENFNLQASSPALALPGFVAIPFDQIGIQP